MNQPKIGKKPKTPLPPRDVGNGIFYDAFDLPSWITKADQEEFYYRYSLEKKMPMLTKMGYVKVTHPETKKNERIGSKDSESDLILVKQPWEYHKEDLAMKKLRASDKDSNIKTPEGFTPYEPEAPKTPED